MADRRALARIVALALLVGGAFLLVASSGSLSADGLRDRVDGHGPLGPLLYVAVASLLVPALFPGPLLAGAGGLLFGTALGAPLALLAVVLGAVLAFTIARRLAHDAVERLQGPRLASLRAWIGERGFLNVLYARLAPGVPYTLVNYAAGLSPVRLSAFAAATAIGAAPRTVAYAALGGSIDDLTDPVAVAAIAVLVAMAVAGAIAARREGSRGRARPAPGTATSSPDGPTAAPR